MTHLFATEKNGLDPQSVALPKLPSELELYGTTQQWQANTGGYTYSLPIQVPQATAGQQPQVNIVYQNSSGRFSNVALGWKIDLPVISRDQEQALPNYTDEDLFRGIMGEELIAINDHQYIARYAGNFYRYTRLATGWKLQTPQGQILYFGLHKADQVQHQEQTVRWLLSQTQDLNGNTIFYGWENIAPDSTIAKITAPRLKSIRYWVGESIGQHFYEVSFTYQQKKQPVYDGRAGFFIAYPWQLSQIKVSLHHPEEQLIRSYQFTYADDALIGFQICGTDQQTCLPATSLKYLPLATWSTTAQFNSDDLIAGSFQNAALDEQNTHWMDWNQDGRADLLESTGLLHRVYLHQGLDDQGHVLFSPPITINADEPRTLQIQLASSHVILMDWDGDGRVDLINCLPDGSFEYFLQQEPFRWSAGVTTQQQLPNPFNPPYQTTVLTGDWNHDRQLDLITLHDQTITYYQRDPLATTLNALLSGQANLLDPLRTSQHPLPQHQGQPFALEQSRVFSADLNGDQLLDLIFVQASRYYLAFALGHGQFTALQAFSFPEGLYLKNEDFNFLLLADLNLDGQIDLILPQPLENKIRIALGKGDGNFTNWHVIHGFGNFPAREFQLFDLNLNGSPDLVYVDTYTKQWKGLDLVTILTNTSNALSSNALIFPSLLETIENGLGHRLQLTWQVSTNMPAADRWQIPFPYYTVQGKTADLGLPNEPAGQWEYTYQDPYYDQTLGRLTGFGSSTQHRFAAEGLAEAWTQQDFFTTAPLNSGALFSNLLPSTFLTSNALQTLEGKIRSSEIRGANQALLQRTTWDYHLEALEEDAYWAMMVAEQQQLYEKTSSPVSLYKRFQYDQFGNIILKKEYTPDSTTDLLRQTHTTFAQDSSGWSMAFPVEKLILNATGQLLQGERIWYSNTFGQLGTGLPTQVQAWESGQQWIDRQTILYDAYGNVIEKSGLQGHVRLTYDPTAPFLLTSLALQTTTDQWLTQTLQYHPGLQKLQQLQGFNQETYRLAYDALGRETTRWLPDDALDQPSFRMQYHLTNPRLSSADLFNWIEIHEFYQQQTVVKKQFFDSLGQSRGLQLGQPSANAAASNFLLSLERPSVYGVLLAKYYPYDQNAPWNGLYLSHKPAERYQYDAQQRRLLLTKPAPNNPQSLTSQTIRYLPLAQQIFNEQQHETKLTFNQDQQILSSARKINGQYLTATYQYDPIGNLILTTDPEGYQTQRTYDGLQRLLTLTTADAGTMQRKYNQMDLPIWQQEANGNLIETEYDLAGRKTKVIGNHQIIETYGYDNSLLTSSFLTFNHSQGRLAWVQDQAGQIEFHYNARGQILQETRTIPSNTLNSNSLSSFTTQYRWDASRLQSVISPAQESITYQYNHLNQITAIDGILDQITYHDGRLQTLVYQSGVQRQIRTNALGQMLGFTVQHQGSHLLQLDYQRNAQGFVTEETTAGILHTTPTKNNYFYDALDRLTKMNFTLASNSLTSSSLTFSYSAAGNVTQKMVKNAQVSQQFHPLNLKKLVYDPRHPHAVQEAAQERASNYRQYQYQYDDAGFMTQHSNHWSTKDLSWDALGRLAQIKEQQLQNQWQFSYDYQHRMVLEKRTQQGRVWEDLHINRYYDRIGQTQQTRVWLGEMPVAVIKSENQHLKSNAQTVQLQPGWNYFYLWVKPEQTTAELLQILDGKYTAFLPLSTPNLIAATSIPDPLTSSSLISNSLIPGPYAIYMKEPAVWEIPGQLQNSITMVLYPRQINFIPSMVDKPEQTTHLLHKLGLQNRNQDLFLKGFHPGIIPTIPQRVYPGTNLPEFMQIQGQSSGELTEVLPDQVYLLTLQQTQVVTLKPPMIERKIYALHTDHLGSIVMVTNEAGTIEETLSYFPNGLIKDHYTSGDFTSAWLHTGQRLIAETFYYAHHRFRDLLTGRFISEDPYVRLTTTQHPFYSRLTHNHQEQNLYSYALNNQLYYIDPLGLDAVVLNRPSAAGSAGHNAVIVGDDKNGWIYYSKEGYGGSDKNQTASYVTFNDFINDTEKGYYNRYEHAFRIKTTLKQDQAMKLYGQKNYQKPYSILPFRSWEGRIEDATRIASSAGYITPQIMINSTKTSSENCSSLVGGILHSGSIDVDRFRLLPNSQYKNIIKTNTGIILK